MSASTRTNLPVHSIDLDIPASLSPLDASALIRRAGELGLRSVRVPAPAASAARDALGDGIAVRISCDRVAGWPGDSLPMHVGERLRGRRVDELDIPVDGTLIKDGAWLTAQLRRSCARCHAHGTFANVLIDMRGLEAPELRGRLRSLLLASVDAITLAAPDGGDVEPELVAAAVDDTAGWAPIRVAAPGISRERLERLLELGIQSVVVGPEGLGQLLAEPPAWHAVRPKAA